MKLLYVGALALVFHLGLVNGQLPPGLAGEVGIIFTAITALDVEIAKYETPLAIRFTNYFGTAFWNCVAVYSNDLLAADTNARPDVPSLDPATFASGPRAVCGAQSAVTYSKFSLPSAVQGTVDALATINVTVAADLHPGIAACDTSSSSALTSCLRNVAANEGYNPIIMGQIVGFSIYLASLDDGWNQLGTLKPRGKICKQSCRNYTDFTGFAPVNSPFNSSPFRGSSSDRWQPLLEDDGRGFFYYQEHVTPHIGKTAKFHYFPESLRDTTVAPPPSYTRGRRPEMRRVLQRMASLDDVKKMQIEAFDDKLLVANQVFFAFVLKLLGSGYVDTELGQPGSIVSLERFLHYIVGYVSTEYDAVVIAWKEKVRYDLIRPTSTIKRWLGGRKKITTWAPSAGTQTFHSSDFEAYIRVMPHSEYVSGSSCLFAGVEDYVKGYLSRISVDSTSFVVQFPYTAGSSKVEPGITPAADLVLEFPTIEEMAAVGGQSRLDGGMHFDDSVPAGKQLCTGIASFTLDGIFDLLP